MSSWMSAPPVSEPDRPPVILYVEDEAPNRALLRAVVQRAGDATVRSATLLEAPDLATARQVLATEPVDLVLLDVRLPDGNGLDLARAIRDGEAPRPNVIIMSASVLTSERDEALATGARAFLSKPYAPAELVSLVSRTLGGAA
jgi:two-component system KDP operon response regulator KdpE